MKFLKKLVFIPVLGLVLTGCFGGGEVRVDAAVANERVAQAMGKTMTEATNAMKMELNAELDLVVTEYDMEDTRLYETKVEATAGFELKATDLGAETMEASLTASGSLKLTEFDGEATNVLVDTAVTASAYFQDMWVYLKATGLSELLETSEDEVKGKINLEGMIDFEETPLPTSELTSEEMDRVTSMLEDMLMEVEDVSAVEKDGDLLVTYNITITDVVNVVTEMYAQTNTELTPSEIEEFRAEGMEQLGEYVTINSAKIVVGVSKLGYLNVLDLDFDVEIVEPYYDYSGMEPVQDGYSVIAIDALVEFDVEVNGNVTITFPTDLDTYPDMTPNPA